MENTHLIRLDKNLDNDNIVKPDTFNEYIFSALKKAAEVLENHCGPRSNFCLLIDAATPLKEPIFTKDGINILESMEAINPIVRMVWKELAYIGRSVEREVGDGTTTAMLMAIYVWRRLVFGQGLTKRNDADDQNWMANCKLTVPLTETLYRLVKWKHVSYQDLNRIYREFIDKVLKMVESSDHCCNIDNLLKLVPEPSEHSMNNIIRSIAYHQAMTSSHGDVELSEAIARLFVDTPREAWKHMTFQREVAETSERIKCTVDDYQYSLPIVPFTPGMLTEDLGTRYVRNHVTLVVCGGSTLSSEDFFNQLGAIASPIHKDLVNMQQEAHNFALLIPTSMDQRTIAKLYEFIGTYWRMHWSIFQYNDYYPKINDLAGLCIVAGDVPTDISGKLTILPDVDIVVENNTMKLSAIYPSDTVGPEGVHPDYNNPNSPLRTFLDQLDKIIKKMESEPKTIKVSNELQTKTRLYNRVKFTRLCYVTIGGKIYDNISSVDTTMDAIKAVRSSLTNGFTWAGNLTLLNAMRKENQLWNCEDRIDDPVCEEFRIAFFNALRDIYDLIFREPWESGSPLDAAVLMGEVLDSLDTYKFNTQYNFLLEELPEDPTFYVAIQPVNLYRAVLERIGEVILKLLKTSETIALNGVVMEG